MSVFTLKGEKGIFWLFTTNTMNFHLMAYLRGYIKGKFQLFIFTKDTAVIYSKYAT